VKTLTIDIEKDRKDRKELKKKGKEGKVSTLVFGR